MLLNNSRIKNNIHIKRLFYNKNIDILFRERNYDFNNKDMGERLFREMVIDGIMILDRNSVDSSSIFNWFDGMKEYLVDQYYGFVPYVDKFLCDKDFGTYCNDCYEKAIDCSIEIYERVNSLDEKRVISKIKKFKTDVIG